MSSGIIRKFISRNPTTGKIMKEFPYLTNTEVLQKVKNSQIGFNIQSKLNIDQKSTKLITLGKTVEKNCDRLAKLITSEMGKPLAQSLAEVKKSANHCYYYAENLPRFLKDDIVKTEAKSCYIRYEPLGTVFLISPFNFPMWLIFKGGIANLAMGNSLMVRCSNSNPQLGVAIEEVMREAGFNNYEYQNVFSTRDQTDLIMSNPIVQGVSFTGSSAVGANVAQTAGKYVKKSVMELGGSDPFVVLKDADPEFAAELAIRSRIANCGQVCLCAKRFIVAEEIYPEFVKLLKQKLAKVLVGDPMNEKIQMGPLVRADARDTIEQQVAEGLKQGGILQFGGKRPTNPDLKNGFFYEPTLVEVQKDNILFAEETFGPIFPVCKVKTEAEMIEIANNTEYGLGAVVVSKDVAKGEEVAKKIKAGMVFVNEVVKSDSRIPSGGVKYSGYGRECSEFGIKEFTNIKLIWTN